MRQSTSASIALLALVATAHAALATSTSTTRDRSIISAPNNEPKQIVDTSRGQAQHEGVAQVRRMARNARKKMDLLSDRVDQIQSIIAQDHAPPANQTSQEHSALSPDQQASGSRQQEQWVPPAPAMAPDDDSSLANDSASDSDNQLANSDDGHELNRLPPAAPSSANSSASVASQQPIIRSVIPGRRQDDEQQQLGSGEDQADDSTESVAAPTASTIDQPSMMGPEWVPNGSYQYFNELNAKNHGGSGAELGRSTVFPQQARKFQNMTILNSDTDLANSYSFQQVAANASAPSSRAATATSTTSTLRPVAGAMQASESQEAPSTASGVGRRANSAVKTYSAANYGKSQRQGTTNAPIYRHSDWSPQTNDSLVQLMSGNNHQDRMSEQPIRWPTLASPSSSPEQTRPAIGLPQTRNNYAQNRYSSVMMPASSGGLHLAGDGDSSGANQQPNDAMEENNNGALSAHRYSVALPSGENEVGSAGAPAGEQQLHSAANSRRRSIEARRQLSSATESSVYERQHMQQPPPTARNTVDTYSSRVDDPSAGQPVAFSQVANSSQTDLKHRSSSGQLSASEDNFVASATSSPTSASTPTMSYTPSDAMFAASAPADQQQPGFPAVGDSQVAAANQLDQPNYANALRQNSQQFQVPLGVLASNQEQQQRHHYTTIAAGPSQQQQQQQQSTDLGSQFSFSQAQGDELQQQEQQQQQLLEQLYEQQQRARYSTLANFYNAPQPTQQEAIQSAAATNLFQRQAQPHQQSDFNTAAQLYLARYQQHQRALAAQMAHQQQQQLQESSVLPTSSSRTSYYTTANGDDQQQDNVKRVAPEANGYYVSSRGTQPLVAGDSLATSSGSLYTPTSQLSSNTYYQLGAPSAAAVRAAAQRAYQRLLYAQAAAQQQQAASGNNMGQMYATSAMNTPVFYEAPASAKSGQASSSDGPPTSARRNYLGGLFKPQASSRYYYAPQLLSPFGLASPATLQALYAPSGATGGFGQQPVATASSDTLSASSSPYAQYYAAAVAAAASNPYLAAALSAQPHVQASGASANPYASAYHQPQQLDVGQQYQQALAAAAAAYHNPHQQQHAAHHYAPASAAPAGDAEMVAESSLVGTNGDSSGMASYTTAQTDSSAGSGGDPSPNADLSASSSSKGTMKQWYSMAGLLAGILPMGVLLAALLPSMNLAGRKKRQLDLPGVQNFTEILSSWSLPSSRIVDALMGSPNDSLVASNGTARDQMHGQASGRKSARLDLVSPWRQRSREQHAGGGSGSPPSAATTSSTTTTLGAPPSAAPSNTTPVPQQAASTTGSPAATIKATVKRVLNAMNNFIITNAQKRKHRSSLMDLAQQTSGSLFRNNPLSFADIKSHLAELVRARLLAAANQLPSSNSLYGTGPVQQKPSVRDPIGAMDTKRPIPVFKLHSEAAEAAPEIGKKTNDTNFTDAAAQGGQLGSRPGPPSITQSAKVPDSQAPNRSVQVERAAQYNHTTTPETEKLQLAANSFKQTQVASTPSNINTAIQSVDSQQKQDSEHKRGLLSCLYKILCDIATRMRKSNPKPAQNNTQSANDDKVAKEFLKQLIMEISEADKDSKIFGLRNWSGNMEYGTKDARNSKYTLDALYRTVLEQECSLTYDCPDPLLLRKSLMNLKLAKS